MSSTAEATTLAAAGMGRPVNVYFCTPVACTLKRARRKAPQMTKAKAANQPKGLSERNAHVYSSQPGAIPKDRRSARESYSTPKALAEPVNGPLCHPDNRALQPTGSPGRHGHIDHYARRSCSESR